METNFKISYYLNKKSSNEKKWYLMENEFKTFEEAEEFVKKMIDIFKTIGINKKYCLDLIIIES